MRCRTSRVPSQSPPAFVDHPHIKALLPRHNPRAVVGQLTRHQHARQGRPSRPLPAGLGALDPKAVHGESGSDVEKFQNRLNEGSRSDQRRSRRHIRGATYSTVSAGTVRSERRRVHRTTDPRSKESRPALKRGEKAKERICREMMRERRCRSFGASRRRESPPRGRGSESAGQGVGGVEV
jgi:hypothetical protein